MQVRFTCMCVYWYMHRYNYDILLVFREHCVYYHLCYYDCCYDFISTLLIKVASDQYDSDSFEFRCTSKIGTTIM